MFKVILFGIGVAGGAGGTLAWLLSTPNSAGVVGVTPANRVDELKQRFEAARAEGVIAGKEAANRVRHDFEAYRLHPDRPGTST